MIERIHDRSHVAWDIERTGFGWNDGITVTGFWYPSGHAGLILNTNGVAFDGEQAERRLREASGVEVSVRITPDEAGLLAALQEQVFECLDREYNRLVAFNAEAWNGGFDLPFLRTRCFHRNVSLPFSGLQFADLWDLSKKRVSATYTTHGTSEPVKPSPATTRASTTCPSGIISLTSTARGSSANSSARTSPRKSSKPRNSNQLARQV